MPNDRLDFIETVKRTTTRDSAVSALLAELDKFGFTHAKYGLVPTYDPRFVDRDILFAGDFYPAWETEYAARQFLLHDYIAERCLTDGAVEIGRAHV